MAKAVNFQVNKCENIVIINNNNSPNSNLGEISTSDRDISNFTQLTEPKLDRCSVSGSGAIINLGNQNQRGNPLDLPFNDRVRREYDYPERNNLPYGHFQGEQIFDEWRPYHDRERRQSNFQYGRYAREQNMGERRSGFRNQERSPVRYNERHEENVNDRGDYDYRARQSTRADRDLNHRRRTHPVGETFRDDVPNRFREHFSLHIRASNCDYEWTRVVRLRSPQREGNIQSIRSDSSLGQSSPRHWR